MSAHVNDQAKTNGPVREGDLVEFQYWMVGTLLADGTRPWLYTGVDVATGKVKHFELNSKPSEEVLDQVIGAYVEKHGLPKGIVIDCGIETIHLDKKAIATIIRRRPAYPSRAEQLHGKFMDEVPPEARADESTFKREIERFFTARNESLELENRGVHDHSSRQQENTMTLPEIREVFRRYLSHYVSKSE